MFTLFVITHTFLTWFYNQIPKILSRTRAAVKLNLRLAACPQGFPVAKISLTLVKYPHISLDFSTPIDTGVIAIIAGWLYWLGSSFT